MPLQPYISLDDHIIFRHLNLFSVTMELIVRLSLVGLASLIFRTHLSETLLSLNGFSFASGQSKTSWRTEVENIIQNCKAISACVLRPPAFYPVIFYVIIIFNNQLGIYPQNIFSDEKIIYFNTVDRFILILFLFLLKYYLDVFFICNVMLYDLGKGGFLLLVLTICLKVSNRNVKMN